MKYFPPFGLMTEEFLLALLSFSFSAYSVDVLVTLFGKMRG
jgi:hypothetical protein